MTKDICNAEGFFGALQATSLLAKSFDRASFSISSIRF